MIFFFLKNCISWLSEPFYDSFLQRCFFQSSTVSSERPDSTQLHACHATHSFLGLEINNDLGPFDIDTLVLG